MKSIFDLSSVRNCQVALFRFFVCLAPVFFWAGCDSKPSPIELDEVAIAKINLVREDSTGKYDWPVVGEQWSVTRPTGFAFLRNMEPGTLGRIARQRSEENQSRIREASQQDAPLPWSTAAMGFDAKDRYWVSLAVDQWEDKLRRVVSVPVPTRIKPNSIVLGMEGRHLMLLDDGIWLVRLPWRPFGIPPEWEPHELDEAGDVEDFFRIDLEASNRDAPVFAMEFGNQGLAIVAKDQMVHLLNLKNRSIEKSEFVSDPVVHLDVAAETGHFIVVDQLGQIHLFDQELNQGSVVGKVDLTLPPPKISPEAARIAVYQSKTSGRTYKIDGVEVTEVIDVSFQDAVGEPVSLNITKYYDHWIEKNAIYKRPNYPNRRGDDLKAWRHTVYWDLEQVIDCHGTYQPHFHHCVATRPKPDGTQERVWFDAHLGRRLFYRPNTHEGKTANDFGKTWTLSGNAFYLAALDASENTIGIFHRAPLLPQHTSFIKNWTSRLAWNGKYEFLEKLASLIRQLPERRYKRSKEQFYFELVEESATQWRYAQEWSVSKRASEERREDGKRRLAAFEEWAAKKTTLGLVTKLNYHVDLVESFQYQGYQNQPFASGDEGESVYQSHARQATEAWDELKNRADIPCIAYTEFVRLSRLTSGGDQPQTMQTPEVRNVIEKCLHLYPEEIMTAYQVCVASLQRHGGNHGDASAFASALAEAYGGDDGDWIYVRGTETLQKAFANSLFEYEQLDGPRVLRGIRRGIQRDYWHASYAVKMMMFLNRSYGERNTPSLSSAYGAQAKQTARELATYYKYRYPMLIETNYNRGWDQLFTRFLPK